jgi:SAM-dependent methyltransferase
MDAIEYLHMYDEEESHWWYLGMREIVQGLLPPETLPSNPRILDAGCGAGFTMGWLRSQYGGFPVGIDCNWSSMVFCRKRGESSLVFGDVAALPFEADAFDLIASFDVLSEVGHAGARAAALRNFHRVLKPGGKLILRLPAYEWLRSAHDAAVSTRHRFGKRELRRALENAGLVCCDLTFANSLLFPVAAAWRLSRRGKTGSDVNSRTRGSAWSNAFMARLLRAEAFALKRGIRFPWGLSLLAVAAKPAVSAMPGE